MKERLNETNKMRKLMDLPLITEQIDTKTENYTVKKGDSLSLIAKSFNKDKKCKISWQSIYDNNKKAIEDAQNKNGGVKTCSDSWCKGRETPNPNLIFPETVLKVPIDSCEDNLSDDPSDVIPDDIDDIDDIEVYENIGEYIDKGVDCELLKSCATEFANCRRAECTYKFEVCIGFRKKYISEFCEKCKQKYPDGDINLQPTPISVNKGPKYDKHKSDRDFAQKCAKKCDGFRSLH